MGSAPARHATLWVFAMPAGASRHLAALPGGGQITLGVEFPVETSLRLVWDTQPQHRQSMLSQEDAAVDAAHRQALAEHQARRDAAFAEFRAGVTVTPNAGRGLVNGVPDQPFSKISYPDGTSRLVGSTADLDQLVADAFEAHHRSSAPPAPAPVDEEALFGRWRSQVRVSTQTRWGLMLLTGADRQGLDDEYAANYPHQRVLAQLDELATQGWTLVQVSEDRALDSGDANRTAVVAARYLLRRD